MVRLATVLRNAYATLARDAGSNLHKVGILACLEEHGPMYHGELATRVGIDKGNLVALIADLSRRMFVEFAQDDRDRRRTRLRLMYHGEHFLRAFEARVAAFELEFFGCLSAQQSGALEQSLTRLLAEHAGTTTQKQPAAQPPKRVPAARRSASDRYASGGS